MTCDRRRTAKEMYLKVKNDFPIVRWCTIKHLHFISTRVADKGCTPEKVVTEKKYKHRRKTYKYFGTLR